MEVVIKNVKNPLMRLNKINKNLFIHIHMILIKFLM